MATPKNQISKTNEKSPSNAAHGFFRGATEWRLHWDPWTKLVFSGLYYVLFVFADFVLWSRHLVFWSLETLTGLSEILKQGTGCVKGRY